MNDRLGPDVTAPTPAVRHRAVMRIPWVERHLKWLYWACAAVLAPWVVYLYLTQVPRAQAHQIRLLGVGLILALAGGLLLTAWTYRRGFSRSVIAASSTATAAFICAWFRTLTQAGGSDWAGSIPTLVAMIIIVVVLCVIVITSEISGRAHARWLPIALTVAALALIPSLVVVLTVVPKIQTAHHLRVAWTGLDVFEVLALASTGFALQRLRNRRHPGGDHGHTAALRRLAQHRPLEGSGSVRGDRYGFCGGSACRPQFLGRSACVEISKAVPSRSAGEFRQSHMLTCLANDLP